MVVKKSFPKTRGELQSSHSLAFLLPPILSQGQLGSCTSWSTAYYGMTILNRIESSNASAAPFSPLNLHSRIKIINYQDCDKGSSVPGAMNLCKTNGCKRKETDELLYTCHNVSGQEYYSNKLYDYKMLSLSVYDIKRALLENSPIVFAIPSFSNYSGWESKLNLVDGVWNGLSSNVIDGLHAMTIVGYDDNKGGGAFQIVNSWGDDFGQNGFFWLKYSDLNYIRYAYQMVLDPYKNTSLSVFNNNNNNNNNTTSQVIRFYNNCHEKVYIGLAQYNSNNWNAVGWYPVTTGSSIDLTIGERDYDDIYWIGQIIDKNGSSWWYSSSDDNSNFCLDDINAFDITNNAYPSCPNVRGFRKESPGYYETIYSKSLTCSSVPTRGGEIQLKLTDSDLKVDSRDYITANKLWSQEYALFDLHTGKLIEPSYVNGEKLYKLWLLKGKKAQEITCKASELENYKLYKFATKESADAYSKLKK
jgi:hypothetical protein